LASACLPTMFRAIEIDGEPYWDGGYAGNPTITPLIRESDAHDTILVQINPRERPDTPRSASEILNRLNEISFNSPLMKELRMTALLRQVADPGSGEGARWANMRVHRVVTDAVRRRPPRRQRFSENERRASRQAFHRRSRYAADRVLRDGNLCCENRHSGCGQRVRPEVAGPTTSSAAVRNS
jgi:predicted acylesterase/phospholipase RssA